jgi:predicted phage terminase large subunit-like protein
MITHHITCQKGPQYNFLSSKAHIVIFGGGAGGGKTYALLLEVLRHIKNPKFNAIVFRRNTVQIRNQGGLWDTSFDIFSHVGARPRNASLEWIFPSGACLKFAHLENADTVLSYQGAQIPLIMFDELTHFLESQFWYMLSRLRSDSGISGYIRATCNPEVDSFVRKLIDWWIGKDGFPIKERSGILRWFIRLDDSMIWSDTKEELIRKHGTKCQPKSLTFIPSLLNDNKILMNKDPSYLSNLMALSRMDRSCLLDGNWDVRATAGMFFQKSWFEIVDALPAELSRDIRAWDLAATKPTPEKDDPDWCRGVRMKRSRQGIFYVTDLASMRDTPLQVERLLKNTASQDGHGVEISLAQDPGSAGVVALDTYIRLLAGYAIKTNRPSTDKITRAKPFSAQCEAGNVKVLRGAWNDDFFTELENFDGETGHDDIVDAASDAFNELCGNVGSCDVL